MPYSRVHLQYHTVEQVVVGVFVGMAWGAVWFFVLEKCLRPNFCTWVKNPFFQALQIRDATYIPDLWTFEYTAIRTENEKNCTPGEVPSLYTKNDRLLLKRAD